ncbi:MAG TPA: Sec-independent protein translocase protein TatB [Steroidobacteraceae bacterium]
MLDFGFSEILLTSAIALVVLGPERLPKVARQVGNWMGRARLMARQLSEQLEREVNAEELLRQQMKSPLKPDQPSLIAPASAPTYPSALTGASAEAPVSDQASGAAAETPPPLARPLPDGHATTAAAMHPPAPATTPADHPHPVNQ